MTFKEFIFKNTVRNKSLYLAYFLSTLTTVMTFFTFSTFSNHPSLSADKMNQAVTIGMNVSSGIIYVFSFFYVLYSMDIFLQSRKKEFGLLLIQGMSPKQLRKMVFQENTIVGFLATIVGIGVGLIFSQLLLFLSKAILGIELSFYFPVKSMLITFVAFTILFFLISLFIQVKIPKMDVQELIKSQDLGKGELKPSKIKSFIAILMIGGGYAIALNVKNMQVVVAMIPVILMVIIGTHFLFNQLSVLVVSIIKKNKQRFWKKTNMIVYSDLGFRMKDNARSFFLVAIITTVAFAAMGSLAGFREMTYSSVDSMTYDLYLSDPDDNQDNLAKNLDIVQKELDDQDVDMTELRLKIVNVPGNETTNGYRVISTETYNLVAKNVGNQLIDDKNKSYHLELSNNMLQVNSQSYYLDTLQTPKGEQINVENHTIKKEVVPGFQSVYVVPTKVFNEYEKTYGLQQEIGWIAEKIPQTDQYRVGYRLKEISGVQSKALIIQSITDIYTPILFVGFFIGMIFFVSAGSFLYFRLYSDISVDTEKFKTIYKLGFSRKEMKKTIYRQVAILFFTPIIVSSIHGLMALKAMYAMFNQGLQTTAILVIGLFLAIQIIYYLIARHFYFRKLYKEVVAD